MRYVRLLSLAFVGLFMMSSTIAGPPSNGQGRGGTNGFGGGIGDGRQAGRGSGQGFMGAHGGKGSGFGNSQNGGQQNGGQQNGGQQSGGQQSGGQQNRGQSGRGGNQGAGNQNGRNQNQGGGAGLIQNLMAMDKNADGALSPAEVTDRRMQQLLAGADSDGNGIVTFAELNAAVAASGGQQMGGPPAGAGPGGGPGMHGRPGEILPPLAQEQLNLTESQRQQLATLQLQVDAQLAQILTAQQIQKLNAGPRQQRQ